MPFSPFSPFLPFWPFWPFWPFSKSSTPDNLLIKRTYENVRKIKKFWRLPGWKPRSQTFERREREREIYPSGINVGEDKKLIVFSSKRREVDGFNRGKKEGNIRSGKNTHSLLLRIRAWQSYTWT